ncbi:beta-lactamase family protein [Arthrobacter zhangbolii]|uniref:Beta-lactamase family protein n=1 Tax=Arthrobacter zhangbolii TaxID=2886936 RepID=A0A9X1S9C3_9MICC|nr:serine hydrolase domain-containing protein [Arthrobacter zhangbolii]MCC3272097.1 beta-lactamase family protein [Arthrobacter zhangbolii]MCC3294421.1 beta-lactamase family protein [Arthrobacter zhangbolii]UON92029.1 beta-lactamase family protein [Arthrobacter zhangbolii]
MITNVEGLNPAALQTLEDTIATDIDRRSYDGANIIVARHGRIGLQGSYGFADRAAGRRTDRGDVYRILSMSKAFTNTLAYRALGEGKLALSTRVVDLIPEFFGTDRFRAVRKDKINLGHLLTHRSGMPATPDPGLPADRFGVLADVIEALGGVDVVNEPGSNLNYAPSINHALIGEMVRRAYGYDHFRDLARDLVFTPLGMGDTAFGLPADRAERAVPLKVYVPEDGWLSPEDIECLNTYITEDAEMPWVGATSTVDDVFRFAEMFRNQGRADGVQLVAPAVVDAATTLQTGDMPNDLYSGIAAMRGWEAPNGNFGLGFSLSGTGTAPTFFGPFTSPRTFGNYGAGSTLFWVDPVRDLTFVFLSSGVMDEGENVARFQKLSTLAVAAAL